MTDLFTIALILVLYYWFFVRRAQAALAPPEGLTDSVVDLNNTLRNPTSWTPIQTFDPDRAWNGWRLVGQFDYAIGSGDPLQIHVGGKVWTLPIPEGFRWDGSRLVETDDCYGQPDGQPVPATGFQLYTRLLNSQQPYPSRKAVRPGANPFYFSCRGNTIERLQACEHPTYFIEGRCQSVNLCYGRKDGFRFADEHDPTVYFECAQQKAVRTVCPSGTVFEENTCRPPVDPCVLRLDGYTYRIDRLRYAVCRNGVSVHKKCPPNRYFHEDRCLPDICEGKLDGETVGEPTDDGRLRFSTSYVVCSGGGIQSRGVCPASWNRFEAEHALTHLPQVFDNGVCARPQLCRNVQPSDDQTVVPAYSYAKFLGNWTQHAERFDRVHGFRCDGSGQVQKVSVPAGLSIQNFRIPTEPFCDRPKLVTALPNVYYDCTLRQTENCPPQTFFDGTECKARMPDAFSFQHLDVFRYRLHVNNWMEPRDYGSEPDVQCQPDEEYVPGRNLCVHQDCRGLLVVADLKRALKLDDDFECVQEGSQIKKRRYERDVEELTLDFWNQRFVYGTPSDCVVGEKIRSSHFAYDATLYKTCDRNQAFVFCPSSDTSHVERVGPVFACVPKAKVYTHRLKANRDLQLFVNEVKSVEILTPNTELVINGTPQVFGVPVVYDGFHAMAVNKKTIKLKSDQDVLVHFKTLVTNPPTAYIQEGKLYHKAMPFVLPNNGTTPKPLQFPEYELADSVTDFEL